MFPKENSESNTPLTEKDLIIPILLVLSKAQQQGLPGLSTPQIRDLVVKAVVPSQADLEVVSSGEVRVERLARNAISSHKALEKKGYALTSNGLTSITFEGQKKLVEFFVLAMQGEAEEDGIEVPSDFDSEPLTESVLVAPALMELVKAHINGSGPVSIAKLISGISSNVTMSKEDKEKIGSGDVRGERLIRNLKSHKTLVKKGLATESVDGLEIADEGWKLLLNAYLDIIPTPDFSVPVARKPKIV